MDQAGRHLVTGSEVRGDERHQGLTSSGVMTPVSWNFDSCKAGSCYYFPDKTAGMSPNLLWKLA